MDFKLTKNFHTHTYLCNHADGTIRDYVEAAIDYGMTDLGFSCHAPQITPDGYYSGFRMKVHEMDTYADEILALRDEYRDRINIFIGYELEYYPRHFKDTLALLNSRECDYVILGQHFTENEYDGIYSGEATDDPAFINKYVDQVVEAMHLGVYTYVAHPDIVDFTGEASVYRKAMERILRASLETDTPLEFNMLGLRDGRWYPNKLFWEAAGEFKVQTVIGMDAHSPDALRDCKRLDDAVQMLSDLGLQICNDSLKLRKPILRSGASE